MSHVWTKVRNDCQVLPTKSISVDTGFNKHIQPKTEAALKEIEADDLLLKGKSLMKHSPFLSVAVVNRIENWIRGTLLCSGTIVSIRKEVRSTWSRERTGCLRKVANEIQQNWSETEEIGETELWTSEPSIGLSCITTCSMWSVDFQISWCLWHRFQCLEGRCQWSKSPRQYKRAQWFIDQIQCISRLFNAFSQYQRFFNHLISDADFDTSQMDPLFKKRLDYYW